MHSKRVVGLKRVDVIRPYLSQSEWLSITGGVVQAVKLLVFNGRHWSDKDIIAYDSYYV